MKYHVSRSQLTDLLLDPMAALPRDQQHIQTCAVCREELAALRKTMFTLDEWMAPEPSPYFDARLSARLREEQARAPAGLWERVCAHVLYESNSHFRRMTSVALAFALMVGGGTAIWVSHDTQDETASVSAAVYELQSLDANAQVFQQLNALDEDSSTD